MAADSFEHYKNWPTAPARTAFAITPDDATDLTTVPRELYVGTGGNLKITLVDGGTVVFANVPDGARLPYRAKRVFATLTTAADIVGVY